MGEITIGSIINAFIKKKNYVIFPTLTVLVITYFYMFIMSPPVYVSETVINVKGFSYNMSSDSANTSILFSNDGTLSVDQFVQLDRKNVQDSNALLDSLFELMRIEGQAYLEKMRDHRVLEETLELIDGAGSITSDQLLKKLKFDKKENAIYIKVTDKNPEFACTIARAYVKALENHITMINSNNMNDMGKYLDGMIAKKEKDLENISEKILLSKQNNDVIKRSNLEVSYNISKQVYEALLFKREQVNLLRESNLGDMYFDTAMEATIPQKPLNTAKYQAVLAATFLVLMISVVMVFAGVFWEAVKHKTK